MYVLNQDSPCLMDDDEYLAHYGIKGMKWGVRRTPQQLRRARGSRPWEGDKTPAGGDKHYADKDPHLTRYSNVLGIGGSVIDSARYATNKFLDKKNGARRDAKEGDRIRKDVDRSLTSRGKYLNARAKSLAKGNVKKANKHTEKANEILTDLIDFYKNDSGVMDYINTEKSRYNDAYLNEKNVQKGKQFLTYVGPRTGDIYVNFPRKKDLRKR